jgi:hypothetical protein
MNSAAQALLAETTSSPTRVAGAAADGHRVLIRATRPVLDQLASDLAGTAIGVVLTDARGHLVVRRASGPWSRVPTVRPDGASAVAPITDPSSGRAMGNLVLTFRAADANRLMRPLAALAARAAREIEQRLVDESGFAERLALGRFLRERRGAKVRSSSSPSNGSSPMPPPLGSSVATTSPSCARPPTSCAPDARVAS